MNKSVKTIIAFSVFPQIIAVKVLAKHPQLVEDYYSNGVYPYIAKLNRWVFGWIPFSMGDIFYTIAGILLLRFLIVKGKLFFKETRNFLRDIFAAIAIAFFAFHMLWGLNSSTSCHYKRYNGSCKNTLLKRKNT